MVATVYKQKDEHSTFMRERRVCYNTEEMVPVPVAGTHPMVFFYFFYISIRSFFDLVEGRHGYLA